MPPSYERRALTKSAMYIFFNIAALLVESKPEINLMVEFLSAPNHRSKVLYLWSRRSHCCKIIQHTQYTSISKVSSFSLPLNTHPASPTMRIYLQLLSQNQRQQHHTFPKRYKFTPITNNSTLAQGFQPDAHSPPLLLFPVSGRCTSNSQPSSFPAF
jgi:hypothetical protein